MDVEQVKLVYLLAASHSGSTLLAMLLGSHPEVCTVGELKVTSLGDPARYICSCRERIQECPFWVGIRNDMQARGMEFEITRAGTDIRTDASPYVRRLLRPLHRGQFLEPIRDAFLSISPLWRESLPRIQNKNAMLIMSVATRTGKRIIVDSSKIGLRLKYLLRIPDIEVVVIRLVRDGRAVALTYMDPARFADATDPNLRGGGAGGDRKAERLPMAGAAREWLRSNEEAEAVLRTIDPSRWTVARYEDICRDPAGELAKLYAFIGADPSRMRPDFRAVEHHVIGNGMRLDTTSEIRLDERWRTALKTEDLRIFDKVAGSMNRRLGYA